MARSREIEGDPGVAGEPDIISGSACTVMLCRKSEPDKELVDVNKRVVNVKKGVR